MILAHPSVPAKTLPELVAYDKANPGKLIFATDGKRNFSGILATWFNKARGADIPQVPYKPTAPAFVGYWRVTTNNGRHWGRMGRPQMTATQN